ncbi:tRNA (adenosine(37)-N6)-threonylcarbamoyltransferase complex ATPase subunit type 1 TsaE [Candidatus Saccharibacteria bacterium]|nr:tRNA (adenosine(37)-N6)-threonylcarbamoyltransferase complex ATPase subunit type 1 TsaE [Candidatus Saccharibacteria bacterium]
MIWQTVSTSSEDTERLGELLGSLLKTNEHEPVALERSARRRRGTEGTIQIGTGTEYHSRQHTNLPRAAGASASGRWPGSGAIGEEVIELRSDLGGGKTTFVRGLVRGLGSQDIVSSPTFTLNQIYKCKKGVELHHFDFYRLNDAGIMADQLVESLKNPCVVTVVEWSDIVQNVLPEQRLTIEFKPIANDSEEREIKISYPETKAALVRKLETSWQELRP